MILKKFRKFLLVILVLAVATSICACNPDETEGNSDIVCTGDAIYARDTQKVRLSAKYTDVIFKDDISAQDIILEEGLTGKVVESVTYIDQHNVEVTLSGRVEAFSGESTLGVIRVDGDKMQSGKSVWCMVQVSKVYMALQWLEVTGPDMSKTVECRYSIPYGSFNKSMTRDDFKVMIAKVDEGKHGAMPNGLVDHVEIKNKTLFIRIKEFNSAKSEFPVVVFPKELTSFGVELKVEVGKSFSLKTGYEL